MEAALLRTLNEGDISHARLLLENGADANFVLAEEGVAPMHIAAGVGTEALKLLLEFGGDPNVRSVEGVTPLHIAATWGELDSVKLLLFNGGNPHLKDQEGLCPVDVAKQYNHESVVCFLQYHSLLLIPEDDAQPKFTRESFGSSGDSLSANTTPDLLNVSFLEDSSPDESLATCARRSSLYTDTLQRKLTGCIRAGKNICMDVTSPRHPSIEVKAPQNCLENKVCDGDLNNGPWTNQETRCTERAKNPAFRDLFCVNGERHRPVEICHNCDYQGCQIYHNWKYDSQVIAQKAHSCLKNRRLDYHNFSYTDSEPDCWYGGHGDEVRNGLKDFHKSFVRDTRMRSPTYSHGCCGEHFNFCDCSHHIKGRHYIDRHSDSIHRSQRNLLSRSCDGTPYHGYDSDEEFYPQTVKKMPKKIPSDPSSTSSQWTKLKDKQESSAEKVCRWQKSLDPSPNKFFPPIPGHQYHDSYYVAWTEEKTPESKSNSRPAHRRSSMYTSNIQRELDQHINEGRQVCLDVTSPGHPYIDFKPEKEVFTEALPSRSSQIQNVKSGSNGSPDVKGKRLSTISSVSASSCDTFVTCDDDTEFTLVTPLEPSLNSNIISSSSGSSKDTVLKIKATCSDSTGQSEMDPNDRIGIKCKVFGNGDDNTKLKLVVTDSAHKRQSNPTDLRQRSPTKYDRHPHQPSLDHDLDLSDVRICNDGLSVKTEDTKASTDEHKDMKTTRQTDIRSFSQLKNKWHPPLPDADLNISDIITSDDSFKEKKTGSVQHASRSKNREKWLPPSIQDILEESDLMTSDESFQIRESEKKLKENEKIASLVDRLGKVTVHNKKVSPVKCKGKKRISLDSVYSNASVKEYLYKDREKGITLLERYVPSDCEEGSACESLDSTCSTLTVNSEDTEIYDWQDYQSETDDGKKRTSQRITRPDADNDKKVKIPRHLSQLSNDEIRQKLQSLGDDPGPVIKTTRQMYLVRLASMETHPNTVNRMKMTVNGPDYTPELCAALQGNLDLDGMDDCESKMVASFQNSQGRCWREGTQKSSFNYLLLDPRVTKNLPLRAKTLSPSETFKAFIHAIFYIGKGKRARPYCHLYEAISHMQKPKPKVSTKVQHILDIWQEGLGVVSLHIFQSVIPVEAYTREACMVEAVGLSKLTNMKRGDYYGVASTWPVKTKRKVGVHLLKKALQIFLSEGERQICPVDIKS